MEIMVDERRQVQMIGGHNHRIHSMFCSGRAVIQVTEKGDH